MLPIGRETYDERNVGLHACAVEERSSYIAKAPNSTTTTRNRETETLFIEQKTPVRGERLNYRWC